MRLRLVHHYSDREGISGHVTQSRMSDFVEFLENYGTGGAKILYATSVGTPLLGSRRNFRSRDPVTHE